MERRKNPNKKLKKKGYWTMRKALGFLAAGLSFIGVGYLLVTSSSPRSPLKGNDFAMVSLLGEDQLGGKNITLKGITSKGKPVVLNYFAGLCTECKAEMPGFEKVWQENKDSVLFVGVDVGSYVGLGNHTDAVNLMKELHMTYPAAYAVDSSALSNNFVQSTPTTLIFDRSGKVIDHHNGIYTEEALRAKIKEIK